MWNEHICMNERKNNKEPTSAPYTKIPSFAVKERSKPSTMEDGHLTAVPPQIGRHTAARDHIARHTAAREHRMVATQRHLTNSSPHSGT